MSHETPPMSSELGMVPGTVSRPAPQIQRRKLWAGGISSIKVPPSAAIGVYGPRDSRVPFLWFQIYGGLKVNVHAHGPLSPFRGKVISGEVEVWEKFENDARSLFVDFRNSQLRETGRATHRWCLVKGTQNSELPTWSGAMTFNVIKNIVLVIAPK